MVVKNRFTVRLVEAVSKQPFKEHTRGEQVYAEVEPGAEYFIEVETKDPVQSRTEYLKVKFYLDGKSLGYDTQMSRFHGHGFHGMWRYEGGRSIHTALKFAPPSVQEGSSAAAPGTMGSVTVDFWQAIPNGKTGKRRSGIQAQVSATMAPPAAGEFTAAKAVRSEEGSWSRSTVINEEYAIHSPGEKLESVTIHYCTALGLIHAGILRKPPLWELARLRTPLQGSIDLKLANITPTN